MTRLAAMALVLVSIVAGCSVTGDGPGRRIGGAEDIPNAQPRAEPRSRYGNPSSYEVMGKQYHVMDSAEGVVQRGLASWYGSKFHGRRTSSGEPYDMYRMTAAHKTLPIPTYVEVTNLDNGRVAVVRVNDRGPFAPGRIIDLSYAAATKLGVVRPGTANVEIRTVVPDGSGRHTASATKPVSGESGRYFVQVGAFSQRDNAYRLASRVQAADLPAPVRVQDDKTSSPHLYRVQIGPLATTDAVEDITGRLADSDLNRTPIIVSE